MLDDKRAQQRANDRRNTPDAGQITHYLRPFGGDVNIPDDGGGYRHNSPGPPALQQPKTDQPVHIG
ncbi:hypothetical protein D3C71_1781490 [compost metagenome]